MATPAQLAAPSATARPASVGEMMWAFNRLSLQGFGGVIAIAQRELVERRASASNGASPRPAPR